jgi:hypothetical protein
LGGAAIDLPKPPVRAEVLATNLVLLRSWTACEEHTLRRIWLLIKESVLAYIDDGALSRGAAIAYYTVTSLAPVLLIVIAIAGLVFGEEAARSSIPSFSARHKRIRMP